MHKKILEKLKSISESFFVGEKTFNADYMVTSTIQIMLVISFIILAEYAKRHIGEHVSGNNLSNLKNILMPTFEFYMLLLIFIIFIQSTMLLYKKTKNIYLTLIYDIYYLVFIAISGAVIFLLKT